MTAKVMICGARCSPGSGKQKVKKKKIIKKKYEMAS